jgi:hypothetical protein
MMIICDKHGGKLRGDDCPYCRIQELEAEARAENTMKLVYIQAVTTLEAKVQELEAQIKLMDEKAQISFNCFWNGGWYAGADRYMEQNDE